MNRVIPQKPVVSALSSPPMLVILLGITAIAAWWAYTYEINAVFALKGFSPIAWVYQTWHPGNFASDFPGGAENYGLSGFMHIYDWAYRLGIAPETLLPTVIAFEIVLLSYALFALSRVLVPDAPLVVPVLVIVYAIASTARDLNLANFGQPYLTGQYYNVADALRILGLVMVLRRRPLAAAILLGGSFATHATMGLMGVACAAAMQLVRPREMLTWRYLAAAAVFLLIAGGWLYLQFGEASVSAGQISLQVWIEMTRAFNYHWYPVDNGFFTITPRLIFLPFLSFLLLLAHYWPRAAARSEISRKALGGVLAMLGLTVAGLAISVWVPVPFLIKLALHRSNDLVLVIGLVYVVAGLWGELTSDTWWRRAVAATILVSPWFVRPFPLLVSVVMSSPAWLRVIRRRNACTADWTVTALVIGAVLIGGLYKVAGVWTGLNPLTLLHEQRALSLVVVVLLVSALLAKWRGREWLPGLFLIAAVVLALGWLKDKAETRDVARGRDYLRAQVWAREHTPGSALFMTDPTIYYGWRDYSRRSSFGNLREWLHTSWLYDSKVERYQEGMRRFSEFDIELQPYLHSQPPIAATARLTPELRSRYYNASDEWRIDLARRYSIDFFVFQRRYLVGPTSLRVVYENEHFMICAATR